MLNHNTGSGTHRLVDRGHDLYPTAPEAVLALLRVEQFPKRIWEPCGRGHIVDVLRARGHEVVASDLIDYGVDPPAHHGIDFLAVTKTPDGVETIVTNPPYRHAQEFVAHGLELVPTVAMLLRLGFLESERRSLILDSGQLARVHVFRDRLPMMHRAGWAGPRASSAMAFAWFIWERSHRGPAALDRISWKARP